MFMRIKAALIISSLFLLATPSFAEYFQYTDQNGNINFTDDISSIPEDQREDIIRFESQSNDALRESQNQQESEPVGEEKISTENPDISETEDLRVIAEELEKMNTDLENQSSALKTEREAVLKLKPEEDASPEEMTNYAEAIKALNTKIEQYEKQRQIYEEKVNAYNERVKVYNAQGQQSGE